jgi:hypothetical protein
MRRCGREPGLEADAIGDAGPIAAVETIGLAEALSGGQLLGANAFPDTTESMPEPSGLSPTGDPTLALTYDEQRELLELLREHGEALRAMAKPKAAAGTRKQATAASNR